jgi:replicative DNA helicase
MRANRELEWYVLAGCLNAADPTPISPDFFTDATYRAIAAAMLRSYATYGTVDPVTVSLDIRHTLPANPRALMEEMVASHTVLQDAWVDELRGLYRLRSAEIAVTDFIGELDDLPTEEAAERIALLQGSLDEIVSEHSETLSTPQLAHAIMQESSEIRAGRAEPRRVHTRLNALDQVLDGIRPEETVVVAGRPGMGKSSFLKWMEMRLLMEGKGVIKFTNEETAQTTLIKYASILSGVNSRKVDTPGRLTDAEWRLVYDALQEIAEYPVIIRDRKMTAEQMVVEARRARRELELRDVEVPVVTVDYLQLVPRSERGNTRNDEVTHTMGVIRNGMSDLGLTQIVASQLNRDPATQRRKPNMHDLRESGAIEQDASKIVFTWVPWAIDKPSEAEIAGWGNRNGVIEICPTELIVEKNRFGVTGDCKVVWRKYNGRFEDLGEEAV